MRDIRICFFGDSFTLGVGDPELLGWTGRVCRAAMAANPDLHLTAYNLGVRRDTSADIAARWRAEAERRLPSGTDGRLVFSFGANDTTLEAGEPRIPAEVSVSHCRQILTVAAARGPVLMIGPAPIDEGGQAERICALSRAYAEVCAGIGVPYLEIATPLIESGVWLEEARTLDGAHPRAAGYSLLARLVQEWTGWRSWFPPSSP